MKVLVTPQPRRIAAVLCGIAILLSTLAPIFAANAATVNQGAADSRNRNIAGTSKVNPQSAADSRIGDLAKTFFLNFEENRGQFAPGVRFAARTSEYAITITGYDEPPERLDFEKLSHK